jgi:hypothetical protein
MVRCLGILVGTLTASVRTRRELSTSSATFKKASLLVSDAETACKAGESGVAADKAEAATELLKK